MEPMGTFFYEEWQSLSKMFFTESSDFEGDFISSPSHTLNCNLDYFCQDTSIDSNGSDGMFFVNNTSHEYVQQYSSDVTNNNPDESIDYYMMGNNNLENSYDDCVMKEMVCMKEDIGNNHLDNELLLKRKFDEVEKFKELENPKKKSRVSREAPKKKKNAKPKVNKNQEKTKINNEEVGEQEINNAVCQSGQSTSSCSSEDDSNVSHELNGSTNSDTKSNLNGKTRASRGAATDPQSLYARRRREKINERLRILQTLVPNGTKVDISTMLEEAVHYVKFLQIQIKLLSSDDMWMYAPVAYNGMELASLIPSL